MSKSNLKKNVFYDAKSVEYYLKALMDASIKNFTGTIAEQIYKDSNDFTYRDSGDLYKSGQLFSRFNQGLIIERTPYARRRYYEGGRPGAGNPNARAHWFEETFKVYKSKYEKAYGIALNEAKKG